MRRFLPLLLILPLAAGACGNGKHVSRSPVAQGRYNASVHPPGWGVTGPPASQRLAAKPGERTMFDSVALSAIPSSAFAVAGYTGGFWPTFASLLGHYPHALSVAISASDAGRCLDVEPGDATASQAPGWVRSGHPCVYSDWWEWVHAVAPALERAGISLASVIKWDANYTRRPHLDRGFDGTQYDPTCLGRNLDCSLVTPRLLSIAQPPYNPCGARCRRNRRLRAQVAIDRRRIAQDAAHVRTDSALIAHWQGELRGARGPRRAKLEADIARRRNDHRFLEHRIGVLRAQVRIDLSRLH